MSFNTSVPHMSKDVSEYLSSWLSYLQMMNGLCSAGSRLSHALSSMVQDPSSPCYALASQCCAVWEELVKSTALATSSIKALVLYGVQDMSNSQLDSDSRSSYKINQQVVCASLMSFINLQYRFSIMCHEFLGSMANTNCCRSSEVAHCAHEPECFVRIIEQCFACLNSPVATSLATGHHHIRSPLHFLHSSCQGSQRRWSEAAAGEVFEESAENTVRRWSMPWESSRHAEHRSHWHSHFNPTMKLSVPCFNSQERRRSTTPDSVCHSGLASQEELQEVIHLLSCRPKISQTVQSHRCSRNSPIQISSCQYSPIRYPECCCRLGW